MNGNSSNGFSGSEMHRNGVNSTSPTLKDNESEWGKPAANTFTTSGNGGAVGRGLGHGHGHGHGQSKSDAFDEDVYF